MAKLTNARIATLKQNGGMGRFLPHAKAEKFGAENCRPRHGARLDIKWCTSRSGNCAIFYRPETDRWVMRVSGRDIEHTIAGDSSPERINAHWMGFCKTNNA